METIINGELNRRKQQVIIAFRHRHGIKGWKWKNKWQIAHEQKKTRSAAHYSRCLLLSLGSSTEVNKHPVQHISQQIRDFIIIYYYDDDLNNCSDTIYHGASIFGSKEIPSSIFLDNHLRFIKGFVNKCNDFFCFIQSGSLWEMHTHMQQLGQNYRSVSFEINKEHKSFHIFCVPQNYKVSGEVAAFIVLSTPSTMLLIQQLRLGTKTILSLMAYVCGLKKKNKNMFPSIVFTCKDSK